MKILEGVSFFLSVGTAGCLSEDGLGVTPEQPHATRSVSTHNILASEHSGTPAVDIHINWPNPPAGHKPLSPGPQ